MPTLPARRTRFMLRLNRHGLPHVHLGRYNHTRAHPGLVDHAHAATMEICYLVRGRQTYHVGNRAFYLRGGDVFLTFPNERHSTGIAPQEKGVLYWLQLRLPRRDEPFLGLAPRQGRAILAGLLGMRVRHFRGSDAMKIHLDACRASLRDATPLGAARLANHLHAFFLEVIQRARHPAARPPGDSLQPVLDHIAGHVRETPRVPDLAARAGLSPARFNVRFKEETGVPPAEYVLRTKIREARRRLEEGGHSVTEIAYNLGFSSSQYFATAFKRLEGISPRDVRTRPLAPVQGKSTSLKSSSMLL